MRVYLDCNATAPLRPEAKAAMLAALETPANPSSVHGEGRVARACIEEARRTLAAVAGVSPGNVTFTSGGTEANALALLGALQAAADAGQRITRLIISPVEHDSVLRTAQQATSFHAGLRLSEVAVDRDGIVDLDALRTLLMQGKGRALVSIMAVNNETGVIQPVREIARVCHENGALFHCDAVQALGKIPCTLVDLGADMLTFSAHKIGGPQGAGALVCAPSVTLAPLLVGGAQENGLRAGTQATVNLAGFAAALGATHEPLSPTLRDGLEQELLQACPDAIVFGRSAARVGNTTCIAAAGVPAETLVIGLDLEGFAVSAGSACSSGRVARSHVLGAMGVDPSLAECAIRISSGWNTTEAGMQAFARSWAAIVSRARARVAA